MEYSPDTCQCIVIVHFQENTFIYDDWIHKCEEHKTFDNAALLQQILTHNNGMNNARGANPNASDRALNIQDNRTEYHRIKNMGSGITNDHC